MSRDWRSLTDEERAEIHKEAHEVSKASRGTVAAMREIREARAARKRERGE